MCGLIGTYGLDAAEAALAAQLGRLAHRGPDGGALRAVEVAGRRVVLGHRRLAIIDLTDAASQPFEKDGLLLVFNGEVYNHAELRAQLEREGVAFRTRSDTEVLLEAWRRWGAGALTRIRGMFAFALLDLRTGELVLARDPFGIKPLFLFRAGGDGIAFASELKALRPLLPTPAIDPSALLASLLYQWIPEDRCIVAGVEKLPAGRWLSVKPGAAPILSRYWDPAREMAAAEPAPSAAALGDVLESAVHRHLVADVPMASLLSGGLDSSLITVIAAKALGGIDAYTVGFRAVDQRSEAMPDDLLYARRLAQRFPIRLHEIELSPDIAAMLPRTVDMLDEPVGDPAAINLFLLSSAARDGGAKVLLSGMGADELFGGYRRHQAMRAAELWRRLPAPAHAAARSLAMALPVAAGGRGLRTFRWAQRFIGFAGLPEEEAYRRSYSYYDPDELDQLSLGRHRPVIDGLADAHRRLYGSAPGDLMSRLCFTDLHMFLPGLNLTYSDRASMAASTELRVPFVDLDVARAAFRLRGSDRATLFNTKVALKRAAEAFLPRDIIYRPKASFGAPLRAWLRNDLRGMVDDLLRDGLLVGEGWLSGPIVARLIADDRAGRRDNALRLWQLLTLETWLRGWKNDAARREAA